MDIDHVDNPREVFEHWGLSQNESRVDPCLKNILLVYVTPSGHGLKIVFKADVKKGNLIDNQHANCLLMRTKNLLRNIILSIGLVIVVILRLLLWPARLLWLGMGQSARWMLTRYRTL